MAVHVLYKSLYISLPSSEKNDVKCPNSALSGEREPRRLIFNFYFSCFALSRIQFRDSFDTEEPRKMT